MRTTILRVAALAAIPVALAACGAQQDNNGIASAARASGSTASAAPSPSASGDALKFAQCMREHGVNVPDPEPGSNGIQIRIKGKTDQAKVEAAQQACKKYSPIGNGPATMDPAFQDAVLKFAKCMREHGVNMADPKVDGGRVMIGGPGMNPDSPTVKKANAACQKLLPGQMGAPK
jgi:hypothetical protein